MFLCSADDLSSGRGADDMSSGRGADDMSSGRGADDMSSSGRRVWMTHHLEGLQMTYSP